MLPFGKGKLWLGGQKDVVRARVVSSAGHSVCCERALGTAGTPG